MSETVVHIASGEIKNKPIVRKFFQNLSDGKYLVSAKSIKRRSIPQNKYYWAAMLPIVKEGLNNVGYDEVETIEDAHEVIKAIFLKRKIKNKVNEDEIEIAGSTTKLTTVQFGELIEKIIKWAAVYLSVQVPYPQEQMVLSYE